jgi:hypothetical protein
VLTRKDEQARIWLLVTFKSARHTQKVDEREAEELGGGSVWMRGVEADGVDLSGLIGRRGFRSMPQ